MIPDRKTAESCMAAMGWYVGPSVCVCVCVCRCIYICSCCAAYACRLCILQVQQRKYCIIMITSFPNPICYKFLFKVEQRF